MYHFIINAIQSTDRRILTKAECKKIGISKPFFFNAIMGKDLSAQELAPLVVKEAQLTSGEIGCALSHLSIFEEFLSTSHESLLVLEDDINVTPLATKSLLEKAKIFVETRKEPAALMLFPARFRREKIASLEGSVSIYRTDEIRCTHAYIINRQGAENILQLQRPLKFVIDSWRLYTLLGLVSLYSVDKAIINQSEEVESLIAGSLAQTTHRQPKKARQKLFSQYVKALPPQERHRIAKEQMKRTILRLKDFISEVFYGTRKGNA